MQRKILALLCVFFTLCLQAAEPAQAKPPQRKTVCLNMIVKDEAHVIEKCLQSVKHLVDYWVIVDTGSTDKTQQVIKKCMKGIPGELHQRPWVNFAHNRNEAFALAKDKADYSLFIDADEVWEYANNFVMPDLNKDGYLTTVRVLGSAEMKRMGLVNNRLPWKWEGVLHEMIRSSELKSLELLKGVVNVTYEGGGGRSKDPQKYLKDAEILEKALLDDPNNGRYCYYLAMSYLAANQYELAQKNLEKRIAMGGDDLQEIYMSLYKLGMVQECLNDFDAALKSFLNAYAFRPIRAEPLLKAATIYRKQGHLLLGYLLSKYALAMPCPTDELCIHYTAYDYELLVEFANCALLSGRYKEGLEASRQLLTKSGLSESIKEQVRSNCQFAESKIYRDPPTIDFSN